MDSSSAAVVQLRCVVYRKMHFLYLLSYTEQCFDVYRSCTTEMTTYPSYAIPTVISHNNIYLFNFLFTSNVNGDSIIMRPTLITLYFIIIHSLQLMFLWTFQSRRKINKTNRNKYDDLWIRAIYNMLIILCRSGVYSITI